MPHAIVYHFPVVARAHTHTLRNLKFPTIKSIKKNANEQKMIFKALILFVCSYRRSLNVYVYRSYLFIHIAYTTLNPDMFYPTTTKNDFFADTPRFSCSLLPGGFCFTMCLCVCCFYSFFNRSDIWYRCPENTPRYTCVNSLFSIQHVFTTYPHFANTTTTATTTKSNDNMNGQQQLFRMHRKLYFLIENTA